jgi:hypothetical protein
VTKVLPGFVVGDDLRQLRPRPYETHVAVDHIPQLRKFVESPTMPSSEDKMWSSLHDDHGPSSLIFHDCLGPLTAMDAPPAADAYAAVGEHA